MTAEYKRDLFHQAVMWHGLDMLPRLRAMSPEERMTVMRQANEINLVEPLWLVANERRFSVRGWSDELITGAQVTALLVFGIWVHVGEREEMASGLVKSWPELKVASELSNRGANRPADTICT